MACQNCYGGGNWTISQLDFTPPPDTAQIVDAQLVQFLCRVGTFDSTQFINGVGNEIRSNNVANVAARGVLGFNVPSLIALFASAPYLHNASATELGGILRNVTHRSAGRADHADVLASLEDRIRVVRFLKSIDRSTRRS